MKKFNPKFEKCVLNYGGIVANCNDGEILKASQGRLLNPGISVHVEISMGNPSVFGVNVGRIEVDLNYENFRLATVIIDDLHIHQTKRDKSIRQMILVDIKLLNMTAGMHLLEKWNMNEPGVVALPRGSIRFYGSKRNISLFNENSNELPWLNYVFSDFSLNISLPSPFKNSSQNSDSPN